MKIIEFCEGGIAFADAKAEQKAKEFLNSDAKFIAVSTANFIQAARCLVYDKKFPHDQVVLIYKGTVYIWVLMPVLDTGLWDFAIIPKMKIDYSYQK